MEIEKMVRVTDDIDIELDNSTSDVIVLSKESPNIIMNDDEIYFGDNPDIYGIFIGRDSPLVEKVLDLIYNS